jgi:adenylate cyclase
VHAVLLRDGLGVEPDSSVEALAAQMASRAEPVTVVAPVLSERADARAAPGGTAAAPPTAHDAPAPRGSIAVLPFANVSDSVDNAYVADGVSEELMHRLVRTPGLRVASRASAFAVRELKLDALEVGRRLNVEWLVEGSVRRFGGVLRIAAQLTDAASGFQVWSESFDRTAGDILAIQAEIADAIRNLLAQMVGSPTPLAVRLDAA